MRKIIFIFLFAFSTAGYCETTGNELYSQLTSNDSSDTLRGFAYIQGVLDSEDWYLTADIFTNIDPKRSKPEKFKIAHICFGNNGITFWPSKGHSTKASYRSSRDSTLSGAGINTNSIA